jgi:hypothetical protein
MYDPATIQPCDEPTPAILPATLTHDRLLGLTTVSTSDTSFPTPAHRANPEDSSMHDIPTNHPFYVHLLGPTNGDMVAAMKLISQAVQQDSLLICTDGSYDPGHSSGAHGGSMPQ